MRINCDLGEGLDNDAAIMPYLDMANIACAAHAGDEASMRSTIELALTHQVEIGAHIGFADREHFGRREIDVAASALIDLCQQQLDLMSACCKASGATLSYVKPHGALYNMMMRDESIMRTLMQVVSQYDDALYLVIMAVPEHLSYARLANEYRLDIMTEAFVDRAYLPTGRLQSRSITGSSYEQLDQVIEQAKRIIEHQQVLSHDQQLLALNAQTLCIHGDNPLAIPIAHALRKMVNS